MSNVQYPMTNFEIRYWTFDMRNIFLLDVRGVKCGRHRRSFDPKIYSTLQKGGDPAAGSPTATLLRLRPSHRIDLRRLPPCGWPTGFGSLRLPWRDGRCVQGPGTYSPRRG